METIHMICSWLDKWGYNKVIAKRPDSSIILFYNHSDITRVIYVVGIYKHDKHIHIGNVYLEDKTAKVGYVNAIKATEITADALFAQISEVTKLIDKEDAIEYYDELMKYPQKFTDVMPIITQYILSAHYNTVDLKSKGN